MDNNYLMHWRTKGSKNGVRLYQYPDGSLTPAGRDHYGVGPPRGSSVGDKLSKWVKKKTEERKQKKEAKADSAPKLDAARLKNMSDDDIRKEIGRMNLEQEYKETFSRLNPQKPSLLKELTKAGKEIAKDALKESFKKKVTEAVTTALNINKPDNIMQAKEYKEWKDHGFDPKYAPGSIKNKYSQEYLKEFNRTEKVKAQQADGSFNAQQGNTNYWKEQYEKKNAAAVKPVAEKQRAYDAAKRAAEAAQAAYDRAAESDRGSGSEVRRKLDEANVKAEAAKQEYLSARDDLTATQRNLLDGESK